MTGRLPPLPERLAWGFRRDWASDPKPAVITITVQEDGRSGDPVVVRLTAFQAWWLCVRLGANHPEDFEDQDETSTEGGGDG